ncbi:MAG: archaeosortase/exosortase family protein [Candidatus Bathyarchaeia archaeon]|nr:archaeosortase/exosortase family protein [Candidatus Bathyarchaeia archaeon]
MADVIQKVKKNTHILRKLLPLLSFVIPFLVLYSLYPKSFEATWKGRTYYLFFLWLASLEITLGWEELQTDKVDKLRSIRTFAFIIALLLPTIYVLIANFLGLNSAIVDLAKQSNMGSWWAELMPLSLEYLVFGVIFAAINLIEYGKEGLGDFSISTFLLFAIGAFYIMDNFYPHGHLTPLQFLVLPTTILAANVLNLMGYQTTMTITTNPYHGWMPSLTAWDPKNPLTLAHFGIGWPCAGVESLMIYTVTIWLFLKKSAIPLKQKIIYFVIGAVVTYVINILRIVTIFVIAMNNGDWWRFHDFYGQLYSITWIMSYPLIMIGSRALWGKIKERRTVTKNTSLLQPNCSECKLHRSVL